MKSRKFQDRTRDFPWLIYDSNKNVMKCNVCIKAKKQNVLTEGTNNFRTSTLTRHAQSDDHQLSVTHKATDLIEVVSKADNESAIIVLHLKLDC